MGMHKNSAWHMKTGRNGPIKLLILLRQSWLRGLDLNQRPSGYEPDELPGCSTPRYRRIRTSSRLKLFGCQGSVAVLLVHSWQ